MLAEWGALPTRQIRDLPPSHTNMLLTRYTLEHQLATLSAAQLPTRPAAQLAAHALPIHHAPRPEPDTA
jgi:hypothetical protein